MTGSLACMVDGGEIVAIAINPSIFTKATGAGWGYGQQLRDLELSRDRIGRTETSSTVSADMRPQRSVTNDGKYRVAGPDKKSRVRLPA
jgi:hypothetical protein